MSDNSQVQPEYDFFADGALRARIASMDEALKSTVNSLYWCLESISGDPVKEITRIINGEGSTVKDTYKNLIEALRKASAEDDDTAANAHNRAINSFVSLFFAEENELENKATDFLNALKAIFAPEGELEKSRKRREDLSWVLSRLRENWKPAEEIGKPDDIINDVDFQIKQLLNLYAVWTHLNHQWRKLSQLSRDSLVYSLKNDTASPPLHTIKKCFRQISTDSEIIQRAIFQRQWAIDDGGQFVESQQAKALVVTDKLAMMALAPIHEQLPGGSDHNYPITYFSKSIYFRHTPHSDRILLIGISYDLASRIKRSLQAQSKTENSDETTQDKVEDEIETAIELMAIPHEVGHYVFHHAKLAVTDSAKKRILPPGLVKKAQSSTDRELADPKLSLRKLEADAGSNDPFKQLEDEYKAYKTAKERHEPIDQVALEGITERLQKIAGIAEQSKKQFWVLKKLDDGQKVTFAELSYIFQNNGWYEELFADMYGCLVTGPLSVLGMQSLIASSDQARLFKADGEHPTPILRPFIMSEMLRELSRLDGTRYKFQAVADSLDKNWEAFLQSRLRLQCTNTDNGLTILRADKSDSLSIDVERKKVHPIIRLFAQFLVANVVFEPWGTAVDETTLSAQIPWIRDKDVNLAAVVKEMESLTSDAFAEKKISKHRLIEPKIQKPTRAVSAQNARRDLENLHDQWDDKDAIATNAGSHGSGRSYIVFSHWRTLIY